MNLRFTLDTLSLAIVNLAGEILTVSKAELLKYGFVVDGAAS